jgi:hypothetical protein
MRRSGVRFSEAAPWSDRSSARISSCESNRKRRALRNAQLGEPVGALPALRRLSVRCSPPAPATASVTLTAPGRNDTRIASGRPSFAGTTVEITADPVGITETDAPTLQSPLTRTIVPPPLTALTCASTSTGGFAAVRSTYVCSSPDTDVWIEAHTAVRKSRARKSVIDAGA